MVRINVFCFLSSVFFLAKKKKKSICRKEQREKKLVHRLPSKEKAKTYTKVDRSSEEAHDAHTRARTHHNHKN